LTRQKNGIDLNNF